MTVDFSNAALTGSVYARMVDAAASLSNVGGESNLSAGYYNCEKLDLAKSHAYIGWKRARIGTSVNGTFYLSDPDAFSEETPSDGYVREGRNKFIAFADTDGDGKYTVGEPFGFVGDVEVGWQGAKFSVELTETHPVFGRVDLLTFQLPEDSLLVGKTLMDLPGLIRAKVLICAVERDNEVTIPSGTFRLQAGDRISFVAFYKAAQAFFRQLKLSTRAARSVILVGGGRIGYYLAKQLLESGINRFHNISSYYISLIWGGVLILALVMDYFSNGQHKKV